MGNSEESKGREQWSRTPHTAMCLGEGTAAESLEVQKGEPEWEKIPTVVVKVQVQRILRMSGCINVKRHSLLAQQLWKRHKYTHRDCRVNYI